MNQFFINVFFDLEGFSHQKLFEDCTYAWEALSKLQSYLEGYEHTGIQCSIPEGVHLINKESISIGKDTVIEPGAYIRGPCVIGKNCEVRHGAYIRGGVLAGDGCVIGHSTEIKYSVLLNKACCPHFNYIGDSILGNRVNLGAGVKLANVRLDQGVVQIFHGEERVSTNLEKLGAIIGDDVKLGCNSVTNPGTLIGKEALCYPCIIIEGYVPPKSKVFQLKKTMVKEYVDRCSF